MIVHSAAPRLLVVVLASAACSLLLLLRPAAAAAQARNSKKGVSFSGAQSCPALVPHTDSSWWYTWSTHNGFDASGRFNFCDASGDPPPANDPANDARAAGMEFVPNFWSYVPSLADLQANDPETVANLAAATAVMTFNEPERTDQANLSPSAAAAMWSNLVEIADAYGLEIVAPCMTKDAFVWFDEWEVECANLYGPEGCRYDYTCIHIYQQPHPCDTSRNWECIGDETGYHAKNYLNRWYNDYGKPVWVTEYGCYPWADPPGCTPEQHEDIMSQLTGIFESPEYSHIVHRYAWFTSYAADDLGFGPGSLNVLNWEWLPDKHRCASSMEWIDNVYGGNHCPWPPCNWGAKSIGECVKIADANANCHKPLTVTIDNDNCYCAKDACETTVLSYDGTNSWREAAGPLARDEAALTPFGKLYDDFAKAASPTNAPVGAPGTNAPVGVPPTSAPVVTPTNAPVGTVPRYICSKFAPSPADACAAAESDCTAEEASTEANCGNGGKKCRSFDCVVGAPTAPPVASPPTEAPVVAPPPTTGGTCLGHNEKDCSEPGNVCCAGLSCRGSGACK